MRAVTYTVRFTDLPEYKTPFDAVYSCRLMGLAMLEEIIKSISQVRNIKQGIRHAFDTVEWISVAESMFEGSDVEVEAIWQYVMDMMDWAVEQVIHHDLDYLLGPVMVEEVYIYPANRYGKIVLFIKDYIDAEEKKQCHHPQLLLTCTG